MTSDQKTNLVGAWCGIIYCAILFIGWWLIGGYYPLHAPSADAQLIADFYAENTTRVRVGLVIMMAGCAFFIPFVATLADVVSRIEGREGPLTRITTLSGYVNAIGSFYPALFWLTTAFRPERAPELTLLLNDIAWLFFTGGLLLYMPIYFSVAAAALRDRSSNPVFPRWTAYYSIFTFFLLLPNQLLFFFKTGPFAWNGVLSFWLPISEFCAWFLVYFYLLRRAALRESDADSAAQQALAPARV